MRQTGGPMSELRWAWERAAEAEAAQKPPDDRRRAQRIHQSVHADIAPWVDNRAGAAFGVLVQDLSTTGVGIVHSGRLQIGAKYLLEIPRPHQKPLAIFLTVVRCDQSDGGTFVSRLEPDEVLNVAITASMRRIPSHPHRGRNILLAIIAGLVLAAGFAWIYFTPS